MDIKKIIKQELKEATISDPRSVGTKVKDTLMDPYGKFGGSEAEITGDKGAANIAAGEDALDRVKGRLQKLGIYDLPALDGIMTTEQLAIEPFEFDFVLQVPEIQQELSLPKPQNFSTLARVANDSPFILEVKPEDGDKSFTIEFDEKEMTTNLPATRKSIRALKSQTGRGAKGKFYNVILSSNLLGVMEKDPDNKDDEKKEGDKEKEGKGEGKVGKETLFNDLSGFFKFVVNNKKFLATKPNPGKTQENIFNEIEKLLLEADVNPTEENPETENKEKSYEGRIYINSIKLGPKAEKRRTGDVKNYAAATGGDKSFDYKQWSGLIKDIPETGANFRVVISSVGTLDTEQTKVFNEIKTLVSQNALVRPSKKGGPSKTKFVVSWGTKNVFVAEVGNAAEKLKNPNISIRIDKKAGDSDVFNKPFGAKIQLLPSS